MSGSYLPDLYFEPPSSWTDAPLFVARSDNPDKQNNNLNVLHLVSPPDQRKLKSNYSGSGPLLPEGVAFAAHSWLLFVASFDFLPDLAEADSGTAGYSNNWTGPVCSNN